MKLERASAVHKTSPEVLTPAMSSTMNKPLAPLPEQQSPHIFTNRDWILPPRPKPGRKPAVENPPTKRKAQNRDAQRAFRERRAAKVGELEDQMKRIQEEDGEERNQLQGRIKELEHELEHCNDLVAELKQRYQEVQVACAKERQLREISETEIGLLRRALVAGTDAIALPPRKSRRSRQISEERILQSGSNTDGITCGRCSQDTQCQCIEEAFDMADIAGEQSKSFKRLHSPPNNWDSKRTRDPEQVDHDTSEIDFTHQFQSHDPPNFTKSLSTSSSIPATAGPEPCGFCQDGTPCICAELDKEQHLLQKAQEAIYKAAPQPLISEETAYPVLSLTCNNNPGTCRQCRSDPASALFCKSLAASRSISHEKSAGPKFPIADGIGTRDTSNNAMHPFQASTLSCADAFTTLSRHPAFPQASTVLESWVPQLQAARGAPNTEGRTAFEIEAASVMGVLKNFDRRFAKNGPP